MKRIIDLTVGKLLTRYMVKNRANGIEKSISASYFNYLSSELSNGKIIPYNSMSISPLAMMYIINHILIHDVKYMVEFGTGISSIFLNNLITKNNLDIKIISVDHDKDWQTKIQQDYQLNNIEFIHAPLNSKNTFKQNSYNWYDLDVLKSINKSIVEFVVIDAPIGIDSPYERAGAFEFFKSEFNRNNFSIMLDDTIYPELEEVMSFYFVNHFKMNNFSMYGNGLKYQIQPVLVAK